MSSEEVRDEAAAETPGDGQPSDEAAHAAIARRAQAAAGARAHGPRKATETDSVYAGLVTRAIAFAIDAAIVDLAGLAVGVVVGLALSVLNTPHSVDKALLTLGGVLFVIWSIAYFVVFWSTTGQTPGNRLMRIRVRDVANDEPLRMHWAVVRLAGVAIAAIPLLLGFVPILLNDRRRGVQDLLGRSVVVTAPDAGPAEPSGQNRSSSTS
jgi:uncharacterized RDD family membrane protein YckC